MIELDAYGKFKAFIFAHSALVGECFWIHDEAGV